MKYWKATLLTGCLVCSFPAYSQTAKKTTEEKPAELKIRIIPNKGTFLLYEKVLTRTEFTNVTDRTLCFPEPSQGVATTATGYLVTAGDPVDATGKIQEEDWFLERFCGWSITREQLLREIDLFWVKLAPNQVYYAKSSKALVKLTDSGQWRLKATYYPPECSFGDCKDYLQAEARSFGCVVPRIAVSAEPVMINVVPASEQK